MSENRNDGRHRHPSRSDRLSVGELLPHKPDRAIVDPPDSIPADVVTPHGGREIRTLVAATDLSSRSDPILQRAALIAGHSGARLTFLNVVSDRGTAERIAQAKHTAAGLLEKQAARLASIAKVRPDILVKVGHPFPAIAEIARADKADLVIMGRRARAFRGLIRATTAERVIRTTRVPVLIVG